MKRKMRTRFAFCLIALSLLGGSGRTAVAANKGDPSISEFFRVVLNLARRPPRPAQPLYVIGAGLPRTGTASFVVALEKLGFHTYHMKDGAVETPGHLDLWRTYYARTNGGSSEATVSIDDILSSMSAEGFNATSDSPACFSYKDQMQRYPNAKVVLTVRGDGDGEAWAESFRGAILEGMDLMRDIPFKWTPMFQQIVEMSRNAFVHLETQLDPAGFPVMEELPMAYERWNAKVEEAVPRNKLLIHAPQDGWKPLCDFLSPIYPDVEARCVTILESGEPYPHVNDKFKMQSLYTFLRGITLFVKISPLWIPLLLLWLGRWNRRRRLNIECQGKKNA
uniref:Sulfotransferase domain-containing protein n=1 Tax=Pseudictyota dubia TaxID=2749911 RepID=A0A7R9VTV4_9STRA|mmetsp:Transcript_2312/g.4000  ORF Transcript_2312/g.4000 Transcript_2312/m.4000 type:complete len:336 (+) Transcript_2312:431-1438(+)